MTFWYILAAVMFVGGPLIGIGAFGYWRNHERVALIMFCFSFVVGISTLAFHEERYKTAYHEAGGVVVDLRCMEPPTYIVLP